MGNTPPHSNKPDQPRVAAAAVQTDAATLDTAAFRRAFRDAEGLLRLHIDALNAINVYPVPDGDTGTNMSLTLRAAIKATDEAPRDALLGTAQALARGALMGARGNSGVILSQVLRGLAEGLDGVEQADGAALARGFSAAQTAAYGALSQPKEGTILTAIREATEALERRVPASANDALAVAAEAAIAAVERTPELLPVLKEAGVVDAGALGFAIVLEGLRRSVTGESLDVDMTPDVDLSGAWRSDAASLHREEHDDSGYCTEFLISGRDLDPARIREGLEPLGTSLLVVGQADLLRVHLHTSRPDDALAYGRSLGELTQAKMDNLEAQIDSFAEAAGASAGEPSSISVVAVASGNGIEQAFRSIGVNMLVEGGQTMNPSAGEILEAIESCPASQVVVLPNNKNIVAAAEQAAQGSSKNVVVVASRSIPQGIAAALTLNSDLTLAENKVLMEHALASVRSGEITRAVRAARLDESEVHIGDAIGLIDGELRVASARIEEAVTETVQQMLFDESSLLTLYAGRDVAEEDATTMAESLREQQPVLEVELIQGGQPHYLYLISLE